MAELHTLPGGSATPPKPTKRKRRPSQAWRASYAHDAGCEVSAIAQCLLRACPDPDGDLVRALAMRLEALSCVITSAQDDDELDVAVRLHGPVMAREIMERRQHRRG